MVNVMLLSCRTSLPEEVVPSSSPYHSDYLPLHHSNHPHNPLHSHSNSPHTSLLSPLTAAKTTPTYVLNNTLPSWPLQPHYQSATTAAAAAAAEYQHPYGSTYPIAVGLPNTTGSDFNQQRLQLDLQQRTREQQTTTLSDYGQVFSSHQQQYQHQQQQPHHQQQHRQEQLPPVVTCCNSTMSNMLLPVARSQQLTDLHTGMYGAGGAGCDAVVAEGGSCTTASQLQSILSHYS